MGRAIRIVWVGDDEHTREDLGALLEIKPLWRMEAWMPSLAEFVRVAGAVRADVLVLSGASCGPGEVRTVAALCPNTPVVVVSPPGRGTAPGG